MFTSFLLFLSSFLLFAMASTVSLVGCSSSCCWALETPKAGDEQTHHVPPGHPKARDEQAHHILPLHPLPRLLLGQLPSPVSLHHPPLWTPHHCQSPPWVPPPLHMPLVRICHCCLSPLSEWAASLINWPVLIACSSSTDRQSFLLFLFVSLGEIVRGTPPGCFFV